MKFLLASFLVVLMSWPSLAADRTVPNTGHKYSPLVNSNATKSIRDNDISYDPKSKTLTLHHVIGGNPVEFRAAAVQLYLEGGALKISGYCASACTVLVDTALQYSVPVSRTKDAVLEYHAATYLGTGEIVTPDYSRWTPLLRGWLVDTGALESVKIVRLPQEILEKYIPNVRKD